MLPKIVHASYCWLQTGCDWMSGMKNEPYISFQWHGLPIDRVLWLVWLVWGFWATVHMCFIDTGYTEIATHIEVQYFGKYGVRIFENRFVQFNAWATQRRLETVQLRHWLEPGGIGGSWEKMKTLTTCSRAEAGCGISGDEADNVWQLINCSSAGNF